MTTRRRIPVYLSAVEWLAVMRACWIARGVFDIAGVEHARDLPARPGSTFGHTVDCAADTIRGRLRAVDARGQGGTKKR